MAEESLSKDAQDAFRAAVREVDGINASELRRAKTALAAIRRILCEVDKGVVVQSRHKEDCEAFRNSMLFKSLSDPESLGAAAQTRRTTLENRLMDAFQEGWNSRDLPHE